MDVCSAPTGAERRARSMKQAKAQKILEDLGGETTDKGEYGSTRVDLSESGGI